jgi:hypothetical protein
MADEIEARKEQIAAALAFRLRQGYVQRRNYESAIKEALTAFQSALNEAANG